MCQDGIKRSSKGSNRSRGSKDSIRNRDRNPDRNRSSSVYSRNIDRIIYGVQLQAFKMLMGN